MKKRLNLSETFGSYIRKLRIKNVKAIGIVTNKPAIKVFLILRLILTNKVKSLDKNDQGILAITYFQYYKYKEHSIVGRGICL